MHTYVCFVLPRLVPGPAAPAASQFDPAYPAAIFNVNLGNDRVRVTSCVAHRGGVLGPLRGASASNIGLGYVLPGQRVPFSDLVVRHGQGEGAQGWGLPCECVCGVGGWVGGRWLGAERVALVMWVGHGRGGGSGGRPEAWLGTPHPHRAWGGEGQARVHGRLCEPLLPPAHPPPPRPSCPRPSRPPALCLQLVSTCPQLLAAFQATSGNGSDFRWVVNVVAAVGRGGGGQRVCACVCVWRGRKGGGAGGGGGGRGGEASQLGRGHPGGHNGRGAVCLPAPAIVRYDTQLVVSAGRREVRRRLPASARCHARPCRNGIRAGWLGLPWPWI